MVTHLGVVLVLQQTGWDRLTQSPLTLDLEGDNEDATGLGIDLGATFRFNFADRWCVLANADYFAAKPEFDSGFDQKIASLNLTGGIGFRL